MRCLSTTTVKGTVSCNIRGHTGLVGFTHRYALNTCNGSQAMPRGEAPLAMPLANAGKEYCTADLANEQDKGYNRQLVATRMYSQARSVQYHLQAAQYLMRWPRYPTRIHGCWCHARCASRRACECWNVGPGRPWQRMHECKMMPIRNYRQSSANLRLLVKHSVLWDGLSTMRWCPATRR